MKTARTWIQSRSPLTQRNRFSVDGICKAVKTLSRNFHRKTLKLYDKFSKLIWFRVSRNKRNSPRQPAFESERIWWWKISKLLELGKFTYLTGEKWRDFWLAAEWDWLGTVGWIWERTNTNKICYNCVTHSALHEMSDFHHLCVQFGFEANIYGQLSRSYSRFESCNRL